MKSKRVTNESLVRAGLTYGYLHAMVDMIDGPDRHKSRAWYRLHVALLSLCELCVRASYQRVARDARSEKLAWAKAKRAAGATRKKSPK